MTNLLSRRGNRFIQAATATLVVFAVTAPAGAVERFRSDNMPCAAVQQTLDNAGVAVIQYPSKRVDNYMLYGRFVSSSTFCEPGESTIPATVISADDLTCGVLSCESDSNSPNQRQRQLIRVQFN